MEKIPNWKYFFFLNKMFNTFTKVPKQDTFIRHFRAKKYLNVPLISNGIVILPKHIIANFPQSQLDIYKPNMPQIGKFEENLAKNAYMLAPLILYLTGKESKLKKVLKGQNKPNILTHRVNSKSPKFVKIIIIDALIIPKCHRETGLK